MQGETRVRSDGLTRTDQLATASEHLGEALESIDLANDRELAGAVLDAVRATDRAHGLATGR